ncbi:MAG TPA: LytTR family DNA-binding domain-containing protein [Gemmatimonadaceae bacterium]|nr:LytTR family DNA-binding domain-containing protein [Gemmatimonadaceae bacterium]
MTEPLRAVIVDDEPDARDVVRTLLAAHESVRVVGEATNGRDAVALVRRERPDLVFLDVQMPDLDGFGVLEELGDEVPRGVVFVTAHDEHAIRAFELHALDYVLKPFGRPRFDAAVSRAIERLSALDALSLQRTLASMTDGRRSRQEPPSALAAESGAHDAPSARPAPLRRIGVRNGSRITLVDVESIDWIEADGDYVRIHAGPARHLVLQRLHALEDALEPRAFVRIHRSVLVNLSRIRELHRESDGGGSIVLRDGVRLRVARGRWDELQGALGVRVV